MQQNYLFNWLWMIHAIIIVECSWGSVQSGQYHIQTDEGPERYFRFQTDNGQFRKEKRLRDGTVVGTEAWIDAAGFLRQKDYIADKDGYRILKSKTIYVGSKQIEDALKTDKSVTPPHAEVNNRANAVPIPVPIQNIRVQATTPTPALFEDNEPPYTDGAVEGLLPPPPPTTRRRLISKPIHINAIGGSGVLYDGVNHVQNKFQYFLPRQYHEEEEINAVNRVGSFGYVDPFGIRRVVYYVATPERGFEHQKSNRYVGLNGVPYEVKPRVINL